MPTPGQPETFIHFTEGLIDDDGNTPNEGARTFLQGFVDRYAVRVDTLAK